MKSSPTSNRRLLKKLGFSFETDTDLPFFLNIFFLKYLFFKFFLFILWGNIDMKSSPNSNKRLLKQLLIHFSHIGIEPAISRIEKLYFYVVSMCFN